MWRAMLSMLCAGCAAGAVWGCGRAGAATRRGATVLYASGADLQSANPLITLHPLARQVAGRFEDTMVQLWREAPQ